ncbi:unnamed protein product [Amoebophrya sp. A25]|nr:unnamed protein product [Amoebophrya sp. A25]|eukprot:GSA25T00015099001.1
MSLEVDSSMLSGDESSVCSMEEVDYDVASESSRPETVIELRPSEWKKTFEEEQGPANLFKTESVSYCRAAVCYILKNLLENAWPLVIEYYQFWQKWLLMPDEEKRSGGEHASEQRGKLRTMMGHFTLRREYSSFVPLFIL